VCGVAVQVTHNVRLKLRRGLEVMQLSIEPNNGLPIYEQLVRQIKYAVAEGVLVPGQVIPSVRDMAKQLAVNPNTVQRAYLQLQSEEVLQSLRGRGVAVCEGAKKQCVAARQQLIAERLETVLEEAIRSGLEEDRLRTMFERALKNAIRSGEKLI
jgi:GntR family transcriptional regulator